MQNCRQHQPERDKAGIYHDQIGAIRQVLDLDIANIRTIEHRHAQVGAQSFGELAVTHIERNDLSGAAFQKYVREATGRGAHVERMTSFDDEAEYGLSIPEPEVNKRKTKKKKSEQNENLKKQQQDGIDGACSNAVVEAELDESVKSKEKKKKKNKTTNKKKDATVDQTVEQSDAGNWLFNYVYVLVC